jgi:hypothetical protein
VENVFQCCMHWTDVPAAGPIMGGAAAANSSCYFVVQSNLNLLCSCILSLLNHNIITMELIS